MGLEATILYADLTHGRVWKETLDEATFRKYPGGSALAAYLLLKHIPRGADPLGPENVLVWAVSPLTGLPISGQSRLSVSARSPLTGAIGDSQSGGFFPAEMRAAGVEAIVFLGRAPEPVYLWLRDGEAELRPASHLWGKVTGEVDALLKEELGDPKVQIAQIGPAGENLVRYAAIINMANRANGRTGMGAVMGSKNLKAVAVRGTKPPRPAMPKEFAALARRFKELQERNPGIVEFGRLGTSGVVSSQNYQGGLPTRNYTSGVFEGADAISGETLYTTYLKERDTCYACTVKCKRVVEIRSPEIEVDGTYGGPEYETLATFGSYCGVSDLAALCKANELVNKYGLDSISCGATIAWAMEAAEKGLLDDEGIGLRFGNAQAMLKAIDMLARREGRLGDLLAEGSLRAARSLGPDAEKLTVTVKGQELPAHMPQVKRSLGLIYAVNPFGADHQSSEHDTAYRSKPGTLFRQRLEALGITERMDGKDLSPAKVRAGYWTQVYYSALDTFGVCQFVWGSSWQLYGPNELVELVRYATGWDTSLWEIMKVGERRLNLLRAFNAREGIGREADRLPDRLFEPLTGGPSNGVALDRAEMERALDLYYGMAGWDPATGMPTRARLEDLDLGWVADLASL